MDTRSPAQYRRLWASSPEPRTTVEEKNPSTIENSATATQAMEKDSSKRKLTGFFNLPAEIRNNIYDLYQPSLVDYINNDVARKRKGKIMQNALCRSDDRIKQQYEMYYCDNTTFLLDTCHTDSGLECTVYGHRECTTSGRRTGAATCNPQCWKY
jgi:hypothetical protein